MDIDQRHLPMHINNNIKNMDQVGLAKYPRVRYASPVHFKTANKYFK